MVNWKIITGVVLAFIIGFASGALYMSYTIPKPVEKVHILFGLDWVIYGRHAAYFVALEKGFFDQEGLSVEIIRGYGSADAVQKVATGKIDIGFGDMSALIMTRAKDPAVKVKMVAMIYAKAPFAVFSLKTSGITKPSDLEGKKISAAGPGDVNYVLFPYFAKSTKIDANKVSWVFLDPTLKTPALVKGEIDAITEFAMQKPVVEKAAEEKGGANMFLWADYGVTLYSNGILVSEKWINERPEVVRGFVRAVVKGFIYTFQNPDEAVEILLKRYPILDKDVARAEIDIVKSLVLVPEAEANGIGYFDSAKVQATIDAITEAYGLPVKVSPEDVYTSAFLPGKISL
jgi:NitT/TauT family transport system substrate-binding protein